MALHSVLDLDGFHIRNVESDRSENLVYTITLCFPIVKMKHSCTIWINFYSFHTQLSEASIITVHGL